jgi:hypothetical protein
MSTKTENRGFNNINIPAISGIENALKIYYTHSELGNKQIHELFGKRSSATVSRLKRAVKNEMAKREVLSYGMHKVNTSIAFEVWGIDVSDLEKRMKKLKNLDLSQ